MLVHGGAAHAHWWSFLATLLTAASLYGDRLAGAVVVDSPVRRPDPETEEAARGTAFRNAGTYPDLETALQHFRLIPPQPTLHPYIVDHVARHSLRQVGGGWSWKFDPAVFQRFAPRQFHDHLLLDQPLAFIAALRAILADWEHSLRASTPPFAGRRRGHQPGEGTAPGLLPSAPRSGQRLWSAEATCWKDGDKVGDVEPIERHRHGPAPAPSIPPHAFETAARTFRALGDHERLRLLAILAEGERCVTELAETVGATLPTVSQRLRVLRMEGLLERRRDGKHVYYSLADAHVAELVANALEHAREADLLAAHTSVAAR